MSEQLKVQEPVQKNEEVSVENDGGEEVAARSPQSEFLSDAKRYRKRAQAAEKVVEELKSDLTERETMIAEHEQTIAEMQRLQAMDDALLDADVIDLEAARLLAELSLAEMDKPDIEQAISELRRRRPYLFKNRPAKRGSGTQSPKGSDSPQAAAIDHAASEAIASGKRGDLLRYLRLRRKK